jgi:MoaA/NifB/PqqE/SkfB family radical SAM enzyme
MNFSEKLSLGSYFVKTIIAGKKKPIFVSWEITVKCNLRCKYCNSWLRNYTELNTEDVFRTISTLSRMGTRVIRITGGEPLLRNDIVDIINYIYSLGIFVALSTNGILFPEKIAKINKLDSVTISLDGPEKIHDSIRGEGSYNKAIQAIDMATAKNFLPACF